MIEGRANTQRNIPRHKINRNTYFKVQCANPRGCPGKKHKYIKRNHSIECTKCKSIVLIPKAEEKQDD